MAHKGTTERFWIWDFGFQISEDAFTSLPFQIRNPKSKITFMHLDERELAEAQDLVE